MKSMSLALPGRNRSRAATILLAGTNANRTLTLSLATNQIGTATVSVAGRSAPPPACAGRADRPQMFQVARAPVTVVGSWPKDWSAGLRHGVMPLAVLKHAVPEGRRSGSWTQSRKQFGMLSGLAFDRHSSNFA